MSVPEEVGRLGSVRIVLWLLAIIIVAESSVMLVLPSLVSTNASSLVEAAVDAFLLGAIMAPVLWWMLIRPLQGGLVTGQGQNSRLLAILETTPDLVGTADAAGRLIYLNRAGRKMVGIDELADLGRYTLREFYDAANVQMVLTEGIPTAMRDGSWRGETELVALDGHTIAVSQVIVPHKEPDGTVAFTSTIARDITKRKRAEEELRHSEATLREAQRIAGVGSWDWIPATDTITWSDGLNRILARDVDWPPPTFETLAQFFTPESWERLRAAVAGALEMGTPYDLDLEMVRDDGTTCETTTRGEALRGPDGTVVMLRGTVHDVTERKRAEANVKRHAEEQERFNRLAVGRELRVIELKQEVNNLAAQLGRPQPYALAFMDAAAAEIVRTTPQAAETQSGSEQSQTSSQKNPSP